MTDQKSNKTYLPLPDKDEAEPPTTGDGYWFTDALDDNDPMTALEMLAAQDEISPDEIEHLRELFEHPAGPGNFTRHRLVQSQRTPGVLSKAVSASDFLLDVNALDAPDVKSKLQSLLASEHALGASNPFTIEMIGRREGRPPEPYKQRAWKFTKRLSFHNYPYNHILSPLKRSYLPRMKEIIALLVLSTGWSKSKVRKMLRPHKGLFKPKAK